MSPLPDELRTAMHAHADEITSGPDAFDAIEARARRMRRQRIALGTVGTASVTAVVVAIALVVSGGSTTRLHTPSPLNSGEPTPSPSRSLPPSDMPINLLNWAPRGDAADGADAAAKNEVVSMLDDAAAQWSQTYRAHGMYTGTHLLWSGMLPDGRRAIVFQAWSYSGGNAGSALDAWTVYYAAKPNVPSSDPAAEAMLVTTPTWFNDQNPGEPVSATKDDVSRIAELSGGLRSPDSGYAIVLAKNADDTVTVLSNAAYESSLTIDGIAVFKIQPGDNPRFEVHDASGMVTFRGPVDIMGQAETAVATPAAP